MKPIPTDVALRLCEAVQEEKGVRLFSQCWGCLKFTKGDPMKRCFVTPSGDNRGCRFINKRFDARNKGPE
jgi:hypothetical protein